MALDGRSTCANDWIATQLPELGEQAPRVYAATLRDLRQSRRRRAT
jgi:hypothetical protein